jgi:hypothetical protein
MILIVLIRDFVIMIIRVGYKWEEYLIVMGVDDQT